MYNVFIKSRGCWVCSNEFRTLIWVLLKYDMPKGDFVAYYGEPVNTKIVRDKLFCWTETKSVIIEDRGQVGIAGHIGDGLVVLGSSSFKVHQPVRRASDVVRSA